jgi:hypothetical protein
MKDKFNINLVWHNCKTYPPEEVWNDQLCVTDGVYTTVTQYEKPDLWIDLIAAERIPVRDLSEYWWADVRQTMAASIELMDARNRMKENER